MKSAELCFLIWDEKYRFSVIAGNMFLSVDINADLRLRKEINLGFIRPAFFVEVKNLFNNKWVNLNIVKSAAPEDRIKFINSGFTDFPETQSNGAPFPDLLMYRNLPRQVIFGFAVGI